MFYHFSGNKKRESGGEYLREQYRGRTNHTFCSNLKTYAIKKRLKLNVPKIRYFYENNCKNL